MWRALVLSMALAAPAAAQSPFPVDLGGPFELTDQHGQQRTQVDPNGRAQLVFFGYANCLNICSAALPLMGQIADAVKGSGAGVTPVMITIDPDVDTVEAIGAPLEIHHPDFVGLTGTPEALQVAYDAFNVEFEQLFEDPEYGWIYSHTGFIHLLDSNGELLTLLPPVLGPDQMTDIVRGYLEPSS